MKPEIININPTRLTAKEMVYLDALLPADASELDGVRFVKGVEYPIKKGNRDYFVKLTHTVIGWRVKTYNANRVRRFGVFNNTNTAKVGDGGFGVVKRLAGTLKKTGHHRYDFSVHNLRVVKKQLLNNDNQIEDFKKEALFTREHPELHVKAEIVIGSPPLARSYMVLAEIPGEELFSILNKDYERVRILTTEQRFKITLNLLYAFQRTTSRNIIHRDLKFENVLVDLRSCAAQLIDFGLARFANEPDNRSCGTTSTSAPEMLTGNCSEADHRADIYALGMILIMLWRGGYRKTEEKRDIIESAKNGDNRYLPEFRKFLDLSVDDKQNMNLIIARMISYNPENRAAIVDMIDVFEEAYLNYCLRKKYNDESDEQKKIITKSYQQGLALAELLHAIRFAPEADAVEDLLAVVEMCLYDMSDVPASVEMFVAAARVQLFQGAKTVEEIRKRAQDVVQGMNGYLDFFMTEDEYINRQISCIELLASRKKYSALILEAKQCSEQLRYIYHKASKPTREMTFDDIAEVYTKFKYFSENIKGRLEKLNESLFKLTTNRYLHNVGLFAVATQPKTAKVDPVEMTRALNHLV